MNVAWDDMNRPSLVTLTLAITVLLLLSVQMGEAADPPYERYVSGTVVDPEGVGFEGVNVTASNVTTGEIFHCLTGVNGSYNISLPTGIYNLTATFIDFTANVTYSLVSVQAENLTGLNFTITEVMGTLNGFVTNGTAPVTGVTVHLVNELYNYSTNSTIPLGAYEICGIEPGSYVAYAEKLGYWTSYHDRPVMIARGKSTPINFTMEEQPAALLGRVTYAGRGLQGVEVTVTGGGFTSTTTTSSNGNYTMTSIPVGSYTVTFSKKGYIEQEAQVSLCPFESKKLDVALEKVPETGGGFISGFDLPHSLMVVGLMLALVTLIMALIVRIRVGKRPELLEMEQEEEDQE